MIDFPIGKQHFRGSSMIGAPWEPPGRKKEHPKCSYIFSFCTISEFCDFFPKPLHHFLLKTEKIVNQIAEDLRVFSS